MESGERLVHLTVVRQLHRNNRPYLGSLPLPLSSLFMLGSGFFSRNHFAGTHLDEEQELSLVSTDTDPDDRVRRQRR